MKYLLLFSIVVFLSASVSAQTDVSISRKEFKTDKPGFDAAWKHIKKGDSYYNDGGIWYSDAYNEYKLAVSYNSANAGLNYKLGVSALFSDYKDEAYLYFANAFAGNNEITDDILLLEGRALQFAGKYKDAIEKLNSYLSSPVKRSRRNTTLANRSIEQCNSALVVTKDTIRVETRNIGPNINSASDDYSIVLTPDDQKMYFASRRALTSKKKSKYKDTKFNENIYSSDNIKGTWTLATIAGKNLVTEYCETPLYINNKRDRLYIYAGYEGDGDILVSESRKGEWKSPEPEKFGINSKSPETSFCMSPAEDRIAFISDRGRRGEGGKDVWFMTKKNKRRWTKPVNAGPEINSPHDEESVRFSRGGDTLWFSSAGHTTIGGFDIFYSVLNSNGSWSKAVNAGYPLNTPWDELFFVPSPVQDSSFYFASNRSGGIGGIDIYTGRFLPAKKIAVVRPVIPEPVKEVVPLPPPPPPVVNKPDTVFVRDTVVVVKQVTKVVIDTVKIVKDTIKVARDTARIVKDTIPVRPAVTKEIILYLTGRVSDAESGDPLLARIDIIDLKTNLVLVTTASSDADGSYRVKMPARGTFLVDLRSTGYLSDMKKVAIPDNYTDELFKMDMTLNKVKVGKKIVMNNILFQMGKAILTTGSYTELDKFVNLLKENPGIKVEISGHTDNTGSPVVNAKLSSDRAKAVVDYLVQKGIDRSRLTFAGYGPDQPIADNSTEAGRSKNRRVEFKILGL